MKHTHYYSSCGSCPDVEAIEKASSSRDAVESSIEISKGDKSMTWERAAGLLDRISTWETRAVPVLPKAQEPDDAA